LSRATEYRRSFPLEEDGSTFAAMMDESRRAMDALRSRPNEKKFR
jgi:hypothetical protein